MITHDVGNFRALYPLILFDFKKKSKLVHTDRWQGVDISKKPEMAMYELEDYIFELPVLSEDLHFHRFQIGPNLPWADRHFELDRVSGEPLNPGKTWAEWPWGNKANSFRSDYGHGSGDDAQFNHTYAERYWPKFAGSSCRGEPPFDGACRRGIRYDYGDLQDVVNLLVKSPLTRSAYLPIIFPEDTGVVHGERSPCSIGYLFRMRDNLLHCSYDIRSCDFRRHFQDDVYLTIRLLLWVLMKCRMQDVKWCQVKPGRLVMHIGSFHFFKNDWSHFFPNEEPPK